MFMRIKNQQYLFCFLSNLGPKQLSIHDWCIILAVKVTRFYFELLTIIHDICERNTLKKSKYQWYKLDNYLLNAYFHVSYKDTKHFLWNMSSDMLDFPSISSSLKTTSLDWSKSSNVNMHEQIIFTTGEYYDLN